MVEFIQINITGVASVMKIIMKMRFVIEKWVMLRWLIISILLLVVFSSINENYHWYQVCRRAKRND